MANPHELMVVTFLCTGAVIHLRLLNFIRDQPVLLGGNDVLVIINGRHIVLAFPFLVGIERTKVMGSIVNRLSFAGLDTV